MRKHLGKFSLMTIIRSSLISDYKCANVNLSGDIITFSWLITYK